MSWPFKGRKVLVSPNRAPARILVADDEGGIRRFFRITLERAGYEVIEAEDGERAMEEARAGRVDLVITDLVMPEQEGMETVRALRKELPGIGIAMSGAFGGQFLKPALMLGADAVLSKPWVPVSYLPKLQKYCWRRGEKVDLPHPGAEVPCLLSKVSRYRAARGLADR